MTFCLSRNLILFIGDFTAVFMGEVSKYLHHVEIVHQKATGCVIYILIVYYVNRYKKYVCVYKERKYHIMLMTEV